MNRRLARLTALAALVPALLAVNAGSTSATSTANRSTEELHLCADGGPRPCVESVLRNGVPVEGDYGFGAWLYGDEAGEPGYPSRRLSFYATGPRGSELGFESHADTWQVTLDMGDMVPRGAAGDVQGVTVVRQKSSDGYSIQITGHPVTNSGQCNPYTYCPEWSDFPDPHENGQVDGYFGFQIFDFASVGDREWRDAVYGVDVFTNVAVSSIPPGVRHDDATGADYLYVEMRNRHFLEDGTTVFQGFAEVRIPNEYLRVFYGIPNPELMTSESLDPEITGKAAGSGTVSVTQEPGGDAMLVRIEGVTFSHRILKIMPGAVVPTRPGHVSAARISATSAQVEFTRASPRGAKVYGHEVRCTPTRGSRPVVTARGGQAPVTVTGLARGTAYDCQVRGLSKVGPGPWSRPVRG